MLQLANGPASELQQRAAAIVTTIADDRAEAWYLERLMGPKSPYGIPQPGRLSGPKVKEALVKRSRRTSGTECRYSRALVDRGCVEILPELRKMEAATKRYETRFAIERLEIFESPDATPSSSPSRRTWAAAGTSRGRIGAGPGVRLNLQQLARSCGSGTTRPKLKWAPSHDTHRLIYKMPWVLFKLGAPITPRKRARSSRAGRRPLTEPSFPPAYRLCPSVPSQVRPFLSAFSSLDALRPAELFGSSLGRRFPGRFPSAAFHVASSGP